MDNSEFKAGSKTAGEEWDPTTELLNLLMNATKSATVPQIQRLISMKADVSRCDGNGHGSALVWAMVKGAKAEVVKVLLDAMSDLGPSCINNNNQNMTLLMFSIITACPKTTIEVIVNRMIELNIDIDTGDIDDNTALIYAARYAMASICELLLSKGAKVNAVSKGFYGSKMTAMDYTLNKDVRNVLKKYGGQSYESLTGRRRSSSCCAPSPDHGAGRDRTESRKRERSDSPVSSPDFPSTNDGGDDNNSSTGSPGSWWTCTCARPR